MVRRVIFAGLTTCLLAVAMIASQPAPSLAQPADSKTSDEERLNALAKEVGTTGAAYGIAKLCGDKAEQAKAKTAFDAATTKLDAAVDKYAETHDPDVLKAEQDAVDIAHKYPNQGETGLPVARDHETEWKAANERAEKAKASAVIRIKDSLLSGKTLEPPTKCIDKPKIKEKTNSPPAKPKVKSESDKFDSDLFYRLRRGERREPEEERETIGSGCKNSPTSVQNCSFAGSFIGVQVVSSWSRVGTAEFLASTGAQTNHFDDSGSGFGGGINFGHNWQPWSNNVFVGVVFDVNFLNDMVQHNFAGGNYIGSVVNLTASAQVRGGVLATPNLLLYGQTGLSIANQQLKIDFGGPETNESKITPGYTLGGGAEWRLSTNLIPRFGRSTSLFLDYRHTWWNTATLTMPAASPFFNYTWKRESDQILLGARFRF